MPEKIITIGKGHIQGNTNGTCKSLSTLLLVSAHIVQQKQYKILGGKKETTPPITDLKSTKVARDAVF